MAFGRPFVRSAPLGQLTANELQFCAAYAECGTVSGAGQQIGVTQRSAFRIYARKHVQKFIAKAKAEAEKKVAKKIGDMAEIADRRILELLEAPRMHPVDSVLLKLAANGAAPKKADDSEGESATTILDKLREMFPKDEIPIEDKELIKAIDTAYKRKGAYPTQKGPAVVQQINGQSVEIYQAKWLRDKQAPPALPPASEEETDG